MFEKNELIKLKKNQIKNMYNNESIDLKYSKNSFNVFFIPKKLYKKN